MDLPARPRAHPRSRGENLGRMFYQLAGAGSSPLTRGKLEADRIASSPNRLIPAHAGKTHAGAGRGAVGGLIPAHAGKTKQPRASLLSPRAHPRSRGENPTCSVRCPGSSGSSPLTRGKPPTPTPLSPLKRLIPAHAGKTIVSRPRTFGWWAHPRSRGENVFELSTQERAQGSSPLTRGKRRGGELVLRGRGLIPAHAGKTGKRNERIDDYRAHPRSRGENAGGSTQRVATSGSSPLTRGKRGRSARSQDDSGLIPAHAGKTRPTRPTSRRERAHPRSRGENLFDKTHVTSRRGSSPLTRGKPGRGRRPIHRVRLIPAHAGKTSPTATPLLPLRAHPRSRGENEELVHVRPPSWGSSPLTRGKPTPGAA